MTVPHFILIECKDHTRPIGIGLVDAFESKIRDLEPKFVASEHDAANKIWFFCTFRHEPRWSYHGQPLMVGGLKFYFTVKKDWVAQTVKTDVSLGYYDHLNKRVVVPDKQWYALGLIDRDAWEETDQRWEDGEMGPNTFRLSITATRSNLPNAPGVVPKMDDLIAEHPARNTDLPWSP